MLPINFCNFGMVIKHWEGGRKTVDLYFVIILTNQDFSRGQLWWRCDF